MRLLRIPTVVARNDEEIAGTKLIQQLREPPIELVERSRGLLCIGADDVDLDEDQPARNLVEHRTHLIERSGPAVSRSRSRQSPPAE